MVAVQLALVLGRDIVDQRVQRSRLGGVEVHRGDRPLQLVDRNLVQHLLVLQLQGEELGAEVDREAGRVLRKLEVVHLARRHEEQGVRLHLVALGIDNVVAAAVRYPDHVVEVMAMRIGQHRHAVFQPREVEMQGAD